MDAIDTNILVRWILQDDAKQLTQAEEILRNSVFVSSSVILELGWVLDRQARLPRAATASALRAVIDLESIATDSPGLLLWAVARFERGADWADLLHLIGAASVATSFVTFDRKLRRQAGAKTPIAIQTLRV